MSALAVGPFNLDPQRPGFAATEVAAALRAAWRNESPSPPSKAAPRPLEVERNLNSGVYGLWEPGAGVLPAMLTVWVNLEDSWWLEAGPAPGTVEPPLVVPLLEALAEARWWEGAPMPAKLHVQIVLEWSPALAARSACPASVTLELEAPDEDINGVEPATSEPLSVVEGVATAAAQEVRVGEASELDPPAAVRARVDERLDTPSPPHEVARAKPHFTPVRSLDALDYKDDDEDEDEDEDDRRRRRGPTLAPPPPPPPPPPPSARRLLPTATLDEEDGDEELTPVAPLRAPIIEARPSVEPTAEPTAAPPLAVDPAGVADLAPSAPRAAPQQVIHQQAAPQRTVTQYTVAAGRITTISAELQMSGGVHRGRYTLSPPPTDSAPPLLLVDWLANPRGACVLPGGRIVQPLDGWLGRELELQPSQGIAELVKERKENTKSKENQLGKDGLTGSLAPRSIERPWQDMLRDASVSIMGVVLLAGGVAVAAERFSVLPTTDVSEKGEDRVSPAISPCSADHDAFMTALRSEITKLAHPPPHSGAVDTTARDPRASYCGLLHRERDGWTGNYPEGSSGSYNFAELAASQACFIALGQPDLYKQPQTNQQRAVVDPDMLLDNEKYRIASLKQVVDTLSDTCADLEASFAANVRGAVLATHIGDSATLLSSGFDDAHKRRCDENKGEQTCLREALASIAMDRERPELRACFKSGVTGGPSWSAENLIGCVEPKTPSEERTSSPEKVWLRLVDPSVGEGASTPKPSQPKADLLRDYVDARFPDTRQEEKGKDVGSSTSDDLWACHLTLMKGERKEYVEVAWDLRLPEPKAYDLGGAGASTQLLLDAAFTTLSKERDAAGRCWPVVYDLLSAYTPVHPLLEPLDPERWVSEEQQLCAQVCSARYKVELAEEDSRWWTRGDDVEVCTSDKPPDVNLVRGDDRLDELQLPWNSSWYVRKRSNRGLDAAIKQPQMVWQKASAAQVCAFHLIAQERIPAVDPGLLYGGRSGEVWAGTVDRDLRVAGGAEGAVMKAVLGFELEKNENHQEAVGGYGEEVCADVATQCFTTMMLETMVALPSYQWVQGWQQEVSTLSSNKDNDIGDVFVRDPWCAAIHAYMEQPDRAGLERSCERGVDSAKERLKASLSTMSSSAAGGRP